MVQNPMKDTLLLIDANSLIHRAFHALPPLTAPDGRPTGALYGLTSIILKILKERKPKYVAAAFDRPEATFREKEFAQYKATRAPTADTLIPQLIESPNLLNVFGIRTFDVPLFEADDVVATLAEKFKNEPELQVVALSGDSDIFQIVDGDKVVLETPQKGISNTVIYNEAAVKDRFGISPKLIVDYKGMVGDKSDNIPGVPGIGPKTASELIKTYGTIEDIYKALEKEGIKNEKLAERLRANKDKALLSKKLATLERNCDVSVSLADLEMNQLNKEKITDYLLSLGFQSLAERLNKNIIDISV